MSILDSVMGSFSNILVIVLSFSALIFVHELGHYLAAIYVGVRVEKFFIGFDAWGLALKKEYKGVIYGIGILPLGGYVKLAGQSDDPREQKNAGKADELPSKTVWQRGLVYVAGVVMNLLFGFILLVVAFMVGIEFSPPILGAVVKDGPAEIAGLRPGDKILSVNDEDVRVFTDIGKFTALGKPGNEIVVRYARLVKGKEVEQDPVRVLPQRNANMRGDMLMIFAEPSRSTKIGGFIKFAGHEELYKEVRKKLKQGDEITQIENPDGTMLAVNLTNVHTLSKRIRKFPRSKIKLQIKRKQKNSPAAHPTYDTKIVEVPLITIPARACYDQMGLNLGIRIIAVSKDSPAERAGLQKGDLIQAIEGETGLVYFRGVYDFAKKLSHYSFVKIPLVIDRQGKHLLIPITPRALRGNLKVKIGDDNFLGVLASRSLSGKGFKVDRLLKHGAGKKAGLQIGDTLIGVQFKGKLRSFSNALPLGDQIEKASSKPLTLLVQKGGKGRPVKIRARMKYNSKAGRPLLGIVQSNGRIVRLVPGSMAARDSMSKSILGAKFDRKAYANGRALLSIDLKKTTLYLRDKNNRPLELTFTTPAEVVAHPLQNGLERMNVFILPVLREPIVAGSLGEACSLAAHCWVDLSLMIYKSLYRLVNRDLSLSSLGGPLLIFSVISDANQVGNGYLLYLVAMISINLAICNLLPFPVLDGGHIAFLVIEWVKGSPPSERIKGYAESAGLICLLGLILTVTYFDVYYRFIK